MNLACMLVELQPTDEMVISVIDEVHCLNGCCINVEFWIVKGPFCTTFCQDEHFI